HLVIATQRPSADVITGLMKANIPSRIAFAVSSGMESRIILDTQGAEKLVGNGDMLYHPLGSSKPTRIQGAFVTDEEREAVINFIKQNSEPQYNEDIEAQIEQVAEAKSAKEPEPEESGGFAEYDELLPQAVEVIFETKQASVSMLQRRLKLGYSRAARIVDQMEELGVVGPFEGSKPRQIIMTREQWEEISSGGASAVPADAADDFTTADPEEWDD
ncbi:MAG: DNA translocase FtsK, partial [Oscillospiraceae bacterium]|nr:DNA translocase FtsK [Oscillospiraceae bacterium]